MLYFYRELFQRGRDFNLRMPKQLDIQGHRGARGLYPENTIPGFLEALKLGVPTLELDVVISADNQVVVSHEAWMNEDFCSLPDGSRVKNGKNYNLFRMPYTEIEKFDCGKRGNADFPMQVSVPAYKPLLSEVFIAVEKYAKENNLAPINYNVELKTEPEDGIYNPSPEVFVDLVNSEIKRNRLGNSINIQSFDVRLLREMRKINPALKIGLLVENQDGFEKNYLQLGFIPETYSPDFVLVTDLLVKEVHARGIKIIPWTVNEKKDMARLVAMGVDGIITDYPDRLIELLKHKAIN